LNTTERIALLGAFFDVKNNLEKVGDHPALREGTASSGAIRRWPSRTESSETGDARPGKAKGRPRPPPRTSGSHRHPSSNGMQDVLRLATVFGLGMADTCGRRETPSRLSVSRAVAARSRLAWSGRQVEGSGLYRPPPRKRRSRATFGSPGRCRDLRINAATAMASGPGRPCHQTRRRSPREIDDGRPLDVAPGAGPLGTALLREQVLVGSAGPSAACR